MAESGVEQRENNITPNERLKSWIEKGLDRQAVAAYGGSMSLIDDMLASGELPPQVEVPSYLEGGEPFVYFALPFYERLRSANPELVRGMVERFGSIRSAREELSTKTVNEAVEGYAKRKSLRDAFFSRTGIRLTYEDVLQIASECGLRDDPRLSDLQWYQIVEGDLEEKMLAMEKIQGKVTIEEARKIIPEIADLKGAVIYLNKNIFAGTRAEAGFEDEAEIIVRSNAPLKVDVISGVKILAEGELKTLKQKYEI